jgi:predicted MFS family arabinose efflux permease
LRWLGEVLAGVRYLFGPASLRRAIIGLLIAITVLGFTETVIFAYVDQGLHRSPTFVSVLVCIQGVGGLLGGLFAARIVRAFGELATGGIGMALLGVGMVFFVYPNLVLGLVGVVAVGLGIPIMLVGANTVMQRVTPHAVMGRVSAAADAVVGTPQALSIAGGAALVTVVDYRLLFVIMAIGLLLSAIYLWGGRALTRPITVQPALTALSEEASV